MSPANDPRPQVRAVLATTPLRWAALADALPADLLTAVPAPGEWDALACLQHIIDVEHVFAGRLRSFLAGQDFAAFDPDSEGAPDVGRRSPTEMALELAQLRAENLAAIEALQPGDLQRRVRHQELGPVTLDQMLHEWAAHDLNHTVQAERALMQPFIAGCGPWAPYFADHAVR